MKIKTKPASLEAEFLLKIFKKKFPDMTLYKACKSAGVSYETFYYSLYKHKTAFRSTKNLYLFCNFLGISVEDVILDKEPHEDPNSKTWKNKYNSLKLEYEKTIKDLSVAGIDVEKVLKKVSI